MKYNKTVKVDFFEVSVKYTGSFDSYTIDEWKEKARKAEYSGIDCWDHSEEIELEKARKIDGKTEVENEYPCNKLAKIRWSYIDEETLFEEI